LMRRIGWARALQRHRLHHTNHDVNFGVTSTLCDRLFGTFQDPGGFAPADPPRRRSRGPMIPAPLRRARQLRA
ncbi:MAG TPA: hypothetical protein VKH34_03990, partial [Vicinamibacterales bacterium]|nr:hypothetical protein [Vicinamibacterales bacterium]